MYFRKSQPQFTTHFLGKNVLMIKFLSDLWIYKNKNISLRKKLDPRCVGNMGLGTLRQALFKMNFFESILN